MTPLALPSQTVKIDEQTDIETLSFAHKGFVTILTGGSLQVSLQAALPADAHPGQFHQAAPACGPVLQGGENYIFNLIELII